MNAFDLSIHPPVVSGVSHGFGRRAMDVVAASLAAIVFAPLMLLIAFALFLEGGRPVLFRQPRIGAGGRMFHIYKFRKFEVLCDPQGPALTSIGDRRLTKIGRILASTKLDELPQLWNVLRGDMAIVGPRPESLAFADCFHGGFEAVLRYKPGLVGPTQVLFRHEASLYPVSGDLSSFYREALFPIKAKFDLSYYPRRTIASDVVWMILGFLAVIGWVPVGLLRR
ncbi:sugar transferase [Mesorhizobium sp. CO1-1-7]|uniref:sugar transferase n=1 Tax=unclassified Mesorhizobium TaxID=325217 RepID=UPI00112ABAE7|nr:MULTISPECIES: sugar transferase [unclassified Mesorhizobium]MBZ9682784.1 sugar transferase [Mesorhizobium sp. CO1-1-2]MBZ9698417.1 sugar transferase [Mesorhizobium sp. CO1-1-9]MBZ9726099.1 sugar transferase [Mesorhizobium sp. CO1-1-11]MBZ9743756.1 sugar transferase [Mesorhizobium sp. CO1-1-7]MBZ9927574.1 sugar transferase [Mesorhizobium sp. BR1-1-4]